MAITKTAKVEAEIEKVKAKQSELAARLRELEQRKTELENTEIVDIVRGMKVPLDELAVLLQSIREGGASASGRNVHKSTAAETEENDND